jgi:hypothetical protein
MSPPPLLALYSNLQFWFSPSFFSFWVAPFVITPNQSDDDVVPTFFFFYYINVLHIDIKNNSVLYGSLPTLGFSQSAMQCVFFCVFFFCTCVRRRKNGTRSITKVHTGV